MIYSDVIGTSESVTTAYVAMTGSPYLPLKTGRLLQVRLNCTGDAATALIENVTAKITSPKWGVPLTVACPGGGIRTAPAFPIPEGIVDCDLPVETGVQLTAEIKNVTGDTPVTPRYQLIGVFQG